MKQFNLRQSQTLKNGEGHGKELSRLFAEIDHYRSSDSSNQGYKGKAVINLMAIACIEKERYGLTRIAMLVGTDFYVKESVEEIMEILKPLME